MSSRIGWATRDRVVCDALDSIIDAPHFDAAQLTPLASKSVYPSTADALDSLLQRGRAHSPLVVLLDRWNHRVRASRLAWTFGVRSKSELNNGGEDFTIVDLRGIGSQSNARGWRAREALAALGEIDWPNATSRMRAAFALARLVRLHLGGAP
jgi:hypothetical protein